MAEILTVTSLNLYVKSKLESDDNLCDVAVEGEISNFVNHFKSGHYYFALKDNNSLIKTVMFSFNNKKLNFTPENGMKVIVRGKVSLYERDGTYQLYAQDMFMSGEGARQLAFERLKAKLEKEGLFDLAHKRTLPKYPFKIGVATSATGAALHDIISVAQRQFPCVEIVLAPCAVQGDLAENSIISAIKQLDKLNDVDIIIIARGGGSTEDLWVFNSEEIARTAYACSKPTISAVGHEIDFSILDFVCDVRAATPTAAAQLALPDINMLNMQLLNFERQFGKSIHSKVDNICSKLKIIQTSDGFTSVKHSNEINRERIEHLKASMASSMRSKISGAREKIVSHSKILETQSPLNNLKRGYGLIYQNDKPVKSHSFTCGELLDIITLNQELHCEVKTITNRKDIN